MDGDTRLDSNLYSFINDRNGLYGGKNLDNSDDQNIYWLGRPLIEVTKLVQSDWSKDKDTEFTFKVKLSGEELANVSASEWLHSYGFNSDGELTFSLKHDEVRPVVLPAAIRGAHYTVTELLSDEQAAEFNTTIVKSAGSDQATVTAREISGVLSVTLTELTFTNPYRGKGTATVTLTRKDNGDPISNAKFELYKDGTKIDEKQTNGSGQLTFGDPDKLPVRLSCSNNAPAVLLSFPGYPLPIFFYRLCGLLSLVYSL